MKQLFITVITFLIIQNPIFAQFTKVENPENYYLGYLGVVKHRDTLFTTTAIATGFDNEGVKIYFSIDDGTTWQEVVPKSGLSNRKLEITAPSALYGSDTFLGLAMRRVVLFSTDAGKNWLNQTALASTTDENRGRFFAEIDNVVLAGTAHETNNGGTGIYRKEGDGDWQLITEGLDANEPNGAPNAVQLETDGTRVFLSASDGFYISDDKGLSYNRTVVNSIKNRFARKGNLILADGTGGSNRDFGFWKSEDNGETFTEVISVEQLPEGIIFRPGIKALVSDGTRFFMGISANSFFNNSVDGGVWMSSDDGNTWTRIGLQGSTVTNLFISDNRLFASVTENYGDDLGLYYMELEEMNTSAETDTQPITHFELYQNYPNPFNPSTSIQFSLIHASHVKLQIFNLLGQNVATLVKGTHSAGKHTVWFDASGLSSGIYYYTLTTELGFITKTMSLIK
ncbi:MAG: T9SS type A sorting domain-containing protein [Bacteroidetes bacterium]|nr:T9SS type A sorting domain-containing protein [Bacteroidota bacterium]